MSAIGTSAAKLLARIAINPTLRQAHLAKDLGISRSAVNQTWRRLEIENNLRIQGVLDYGVVGMQLIYGWAKDVAFSQSLPKFKAWIQRNPFSVVGFESLVTTSNDSRLFFEALVPNDPDSNNFFRTLRSFEKAPYNLNMTIEPALELGIYLNMGLFDGSSWKFDSGFKLEASIDGARPYADILPVSNAIYQTPPVKTTPEDLATISLLEKNYFASWKQLQKHFELFGIESPSERTLRRKLKEHRTRNLRPYLHIENIGLTKSVVITLKASNSSEIYKLLRAQTILFPKARVLSGRNSIAIILDLPETSDWLLISNTMSNVVGSQTQMCTFIADRFPNMKWLEDITQYLLSKDK